MRASFNWLKDYVDIRISAEALAEKLTMAGLEVTSLSKIDQDSIMDIEITPNRADCLSIIGIAREVAAITGKKLKLPDIFPVRGKSSLRPGIQIRAKKQCPRYTARVIKNVRVGPSPEWLVRRLEAIGVHSVNNIVDITNFCLLEFGQPLHAFDLDKLQGARIVVRLAEQGEQIITIDGVKREPGPAVLVIADKSAPQAIAGIMGAKASEVSESTANILLESAYFDPLTIYRASRQLGLATQSSYRFERGVDLEGVHLAGLRAAGLIKKLAAGGHKKSKGLALGALVDKGAKKSKPRRIRLSYANANRLLGQELAAGKIKAALQALGFSLVRRSKQGLLVQAPSFRPDTSREADLIEEVARLSGYDNIPLSMAQLTPKLSQAGQLELASEEAYRLVRQNLCSLGLNEIMSYSLISRQALRNLEQGQENVLTVKNPLSYEQEILRPTLMAGMLNAMLININRNNNSLKLFELSRVYQKQADGSTREFTHLCLGVSGKDAQSWLQKPQQLGLYHLKGIVEALLKKLGIGGFLFTRNELPIFTVGRCAEIAINKEPIGFLGEVKRDILDRFNIGPSVYLANLEAEKLLPKISQEKRFAPLARYPAVDRDISLLAPEGLNVRQIASLIKSIGGEMVTKVELFDQYTGEQVPAGFRGLSFSIEYRSPERTLTAEEVDKLHQQVRQGLCQELKVQLR